ASAVTTVTIAAFAEFPSRILAPLAITLAFFRLLVIGLHWLGLAVQLAPRNFFGQLLSLGIFFVCVLLVFAVETLFRRFIIIRQKAVEAGNAYYFRLIHWRKIADAIANKIDVFRFDFPIGPFVGMVCVPRIVARRLHFAKHFVTLVVSAQEYAAKGN